MDLIRLNTYWTFNFARCMWDKWYYLVFFMIPFKKIQGHWHTNGIIRITSSSILLKIGVSTRSREREKNPLGLFHRRLNDSISLGIIQGVYDLFVKNACGDRRYQGYIEQQRSLSRPAALLLIFCCKLWICVKFIWYSTTCQFNLEYHRLYMYSLLE